jgi:hypothetical protein
MDFRNRGTGGDRAVHEAAGVVGDSAAFNELVLRRLDRIEAKVDGVESQLAVLASQEPAKQWYTTAEVATAVGRRDYTVREWCRKGQAKAKKGPNGRGWLISHEELTLLRERGPLPEPKH